MAKRDETCTCVRIHYERKIAGKVVEIDWMVIELSCVEVDELRTVVGFLF